MEYAMNDLRLKNALVQVLESEQNVSLGLEKITALLKSEQDGFDWVGFYFNDFENEVLCLGPFSGEETEHQRIPFGRGICGQVAQSGKSFLVADVSEESNYLACSLATKSEIVVPLYLGERAIGQLDIDSHQKARFGAGEEAFLTDLCALIAAQYGAALEEYRQDLVG
jgi:GAF domain-containing protein